MVIYSNFISCRKHVLISFRNYFPIVKPAQTSHSYQANLRIAEADHKKPELVFLSSSGNDGGEPAPVTTGDHGTVPEPATAKQVTKRETIPSGPVKITESYSVVKRVAN